MPIRVTHVVKSLDKRSGGPAKSVTFLADQLAKKGLEVTLVSFSKNDAEIEKPRVSKVKLVIHSTIKLFFFQWNHWRKQNNPFVIVLNSNAVHIHGVWSPEITIYAFLAIFLKKPLFLHARGMLTRKALKHHALRKKLALAFYQRTIIRKAVTLYATAESERKEIKDLFKCNCIRLVGNPTYANKQLLSLDPVKQNKGKKLKFLYLGRVHPLKGLSILIDTFIKFRQYDWELTIAGPGSKSYVETLIKKSKKFQLSSKIKFREMVYQKEKVQLFKENDIFVFPSFSENYGIVVDEALQAATPVITTTGTPWSDLLQYNCGWYVEPTIDGLSEALLEALSINLKDLRGMGLRGRAYISSIDRGSVVEEISNDYIRVCKSQ